MTSKAIIVNENNKAKIEEAIHEAQGKASVRCISYNTVTLAIDQIEKKFANVPKKHREGLVFSIDHHAQNFPHAYKYRAESTQFELTYSKGKWRVSHFHRYYTRTYGNDYICTVMPEATKQAIIKSFEVFQ